MYAPAVLPVVFAVKTADKSFQRRLIWEALLSGEEFRDLKDAGFDYVDGRGYVAKPTEKAKALIKKYQIHPTKTEAGGNENGQTSDIVTENQNRANTLRGQSETTSEANSNDKGKRQNETAEQKKQVEKQPEPKTEGTPQAQIQELEARIQKVQAQIQKLRRLKELIESNPANADEYIMELQSVAAEIMLEGDNPEAQALAQALTQQITALTQAVQPQQEKAEQPKQKVESVERKETAAAKDGENKKKPALAEGYTTESGRPLSEADEKEFILHDGEINFGMIDKTIADATGGELKEAPIRLQVGNTGMGLIHAKKHNDDAVRAGFKSIEDFIADVAANFDRIYKRANQTGNDTYILVKMGDGSAGVAHSTAPIYFEVAKDKGGGFYNIITAIPKGDRGLKKGIKKELLVYSRPVLDSAAISNDSAVSNQGSNNVGATQENVPTSDSTSNSSKTIISQEASESKAKEREAVTTQENEREQEAEQPTAKPTSAWWENIKKNLASRLANSKVKSSSKYYDKNGNIVFEMVRKHLSTKRWMNEHPKMIDAALQAIKGDENTIRIIERLSALQQAAVVDAIENGMENYGFSKEEADKVRKYQIGGITTKRQHALEDLIKGIRAIADENEDKDTKQASENIANGKKAIQKIIDTHETVENAMFREDVGNIDFVWGEEGHGAKFKGGYGIAHIIAKRNAENGSGVETANKLVEVIAKGKDKERQESDNNAGEPRLKIHYDGYTAVLSLKDADKNTWLLTGWEDGKNNKKAAASANGEGYDSTTATTATPTLTRRNGETAASNKSISQEAKGSNQQSNESSAEQQAAEASAAVKKPKPDKNGVVPIYANNHNRYFEGEELDKVREDNTKAIMKAAQAIADKYDKGELSASEAKTQITALYKHYYSKAKVKPYTDDLQERINLLKKEISAKKQEAEQSSNRQKQQKAEEIEAEKEATKDIVTKAAKTVEGDPSEVEALDDKTRDALNEALTEDDVADLEGAATDSELDKDADAGRKELEAVILVDFATEGKLDDGFNERLKKLEKYFAYEGMPFESTRAAMQKYGRLLIRTLAAAKDTFVKAGGITARGYEVAIASNEKAHRSHKEILNDMRDALPNGSFERQDNGDYEISMPNGAKIGLNIKDRIIVNASEEAQAKASHGINPKEDIVIEGSWEKLTGKMLDSFLNLSRESRKGTAFHEVFHAAWDLALTEREQSALLKYFSKIAKEQGRDVYEVMADAYADWELARRRERSSIFGKLWQKIKDFARRLRDVFTGMDNLHGIMQQIESGKVWEQSGDETQKNSDVRYAVTNRRITGETEDADYFQAIRNGDIEEAQRLVNEKAAREGFADAIPEQTKAYNLRTGAAPKKLSRFIRCSLLHQTVHQLHYS